MQLEAATDINDWMRSTRKRNLRLYSFYRLAIASTLLLSQAISHSKQSSQILLSILIAYFVFSCASTLLSWSSHKTFNLSLPIQTCIDIGFIVLMMHVYHENQSGVGLLLIISIVFASLISEGRHALFYAAIASIAVLAEEFYNIQSLNTEPNYTNAAMLCLSCFATAWLAHTLAKRMQSSERLASEREIDLLNLAKINELIAQEMPNGVLVTDQQQHLQHFNPQFTQLTELSEENLNQAIQHQFPLSVLIPELADLLDEWIHTKSGSHHHNDEAVKLTLTNRDLGIRFLPVSESKEDGAVIFVEDWSQIQTQAHQVKLAALGRLTANIAHEIRNPLSSISHANQLLQEDNTDPLTKRMLDIITVNVERLDQIIKDVLELNRRDRTNQENIHLDSFIPEFYNQFCAVEKIDNEKFTLNIESAHTDFAFDRRHINQILWNLCKNGWRHSQQKSSSLKLAIKAHANLNFMVLSITDDGSGIDPSIQASLFEPFITTEKTGTGLGLYIAKELAEANGAKLDFTSSPTGTQFTLVIKKSN